MSAPADQPPGLPDGNPVIRHRFTADPTALVHDGVAYLYTASTTAPTAGSSPWS